MYFECGCNSIEPFVFLIIQQRLQFNLCKNIKIWDIFIKFPHVAEHYLTFIGKKQGIYLNKYPVVS